MSTLLRMEIHRCSDLECMELKVRWGAGDEAFDAQDRQQGGSGDAVGRGLWALRLPCASNALSVQGKD